MPGDAALGKAAAAQSPGEAGLLRRFVWRDRDHAIGLARMLCCSMPAVLRGIMAA
jgi:hypothetical protein